MGFFDFLGAVGNIFGEIAAFFGALFAFLWNVMIALFQFIWDTLVAVVNAIVNVFQKAQTFFEHLWTDYLKVAFGKIWDWIKLLFTHPLQAIRQLLKWLQKVRAWYDTHILKILQRQIQMIQRIRQFLAVLRIFHVKWAQRLDDKLASIQGKIEASIEFVRGYFNLIIDWIALIVDPQSVIRRSVLGAWLITHLGPLKRIVGFGDSRPLTQDEQDQIAKDSQRYTAANVKEHINTLALTGPTADDQMQRAAARAALEAAIGQPLPF